MLRRLSTVSVFFKPSYRTLSSLVGRELKLARPITNPLAKTKIQLSPTLHFYQPPFLIRNMFRQDDIENAEQAFKTGIAHFNKGEMNEGFLAWKKAFANKLLNKEMSYFKLLFQFCHNDNLVELTFPDYAKLIIHRQFAKEIAYLCIHLVSPKFTKCENYQILETLLNHDKNLKSLFENLRWLAKTDFDFHFQRMQLFKAINHANEIRQILLYADFGDGTEKNLLKKQFFSLLMENQECLPTIANKVMHETRRGLLNVTCHDLQKMILDITESQYEKNDSDTGKTPIHLGSSR